MTDKPYNTALDPWVYIRDELLDVEEKPLMDLVEQHRVDALKHSYQGHLACLCGNASCKASAVYMALDTLLDALCHAVTVLLEIGIEPTEPMEIRHRVETENIVTQLLIAVRTMALMHDEWHRTALVLPPARDIQ